MSLFFLQPRWVQVEAFPGPSPPHPLPTPASPCPFPLLLLVLFACHLLVVSIATTTKWPKDNRGALGVLGERNDEGFDF